MADPPTPPTTDFAAPALARLLGGRRGLMLACLLTAAFALVTFLPARHNAFVYDDHPIVRQNPAVRASLSAEPMPWYRIWLEPYWLPSVSPDKLYRPLTTWTLRANAAFAGEPLEPWRFRVVNLVLHALASVGVVVLGWRLAGSVAAGLVAGLLFATHPVHTEAVVPIYGRSELLAGCLGAWLLVRHLRPPRPDGRPRTADLVLNPLLLLAAIMSKEHAIFLWPAMMIIDLWRRRQTAGSANRLSLRDWFNRIFAPAQVGYVLAAAVFLFFRYLVFGWKTHMEASRTRIFDVPMAHVGLVEHLLTPFRLLWVVVRNLLQPESLCPIWSYPALSPADRLYGDVLAGMVLATAMLALTGYLWYRRDLAGALLAGMLLTLAIPIQAIPVARWFYAERWLYLPSVFMAVLVAAAWRRWGGRGASVLFGLAVAILLLPQSWQYATRFADDLTLQREVILRQPNNFHGRRNYASLLYLQGRYPEAVQAAQQIIERFGDVSDAYGVLLLSYLELEDGRRALAAIEKYESLRAERGGPTLSEERRRAEALIEKSRAAEHRSGRVRGS